MKKSIFAVLVLLLIIVSLPSIGNTFIKNSIDERLLELKSFGLQTSKDESVSTYFNTSRHFEFSLKDSYKQIPPYLNTMLEGVLYHIEYNLLNDDFKGYIKDINEEYILKSGIKLILSLEKAKFQGNGEILAPKELSSKVKEFHFDMSQDEKSLNIRLSNFKSTSNFESLNTYITSVDVENTFVSLKGTGNDINMSIEKLRANASSNEQGESTQLNSKTSIKRLEFSSNLEKFNMEKFNFDIALSGVDKKEYLNFTELLSQNNIMNTAKSNAALQTSVMKLLSKGIVLEIADFSVEEFSQNATETIKGFDIKSNIRLKKDKDLVQKMQVSPLMAKASVNGTSLN